MGFIVVFFASIYYYVASVHHWLLLNCVAFQKNGAIIEKMRFELVFDNFLVLCQS